MSFEMLKWASKRRVNSPLQRAVLQCLADDHRIETGRCRPTIDYIADWCGASPSGVKKAIRCLEELGLIEADRRHGRLNFYKFHMEQVSHSVTQSEPLSDPVTESPSPLSDSQLSHSVPLTESLSDPSPGQDTLTHTGSGKKWWCNLEDYEPSDEVTQAVDVQPGVDVQWELEKFRKKYHRRQSRTREELDMDWQRWLLQAFPRPTPRSEGRSSNVPNHAQVVRSFYTDSPEFKLHEEAFTRCVFARLENKPMPEFTGLLVPVRDIAEHMVTVAEERAPDDPAGAVWGSYREILERKLKEASTHQPAAARM